MKNVFVFFLFAFFLAFCKNNIKNLREDPSDQNIKRHAVAITETYLKREFNEAKKSVSKDGLIVFNDKDVKCLIDPSKIVTGEINDDSSTDAIVPVFFFRNQVLDHTDQLILISTAGEFVIAKIVKNEMKVVSIRERVIYAEISKLAPDAPNFGCKVCKEVVKFKFTGDSLSLVK